MSTCASILSIHLLVHILASVYSHSLYKRKGQGMNPSSIEINLVVTFALLACLASLVYIEKKVIAGTIAVILFGHSIYTLIRDVIEYFSYKTRLRVARQIMKETGEKSDLSMKGYSSLNTLMLSVLLTIYALFALGAVCYVTLISPTSPLVEDGAISFEQLQQLSKIRPE